MRILIPDGGTYFRSVLALSESIGPENELYIAAMSYEMHWLRRLLQPRHCRDVLPITHVDSDPDAFIEELAAYISRYEIDLVLPYSDQVAAPCVLHADRLGAAVPLPPFETFVRALDKWETYQLASALSLPLPRTLSCEDPEAISRWMAKEALDYPIIVKPRKRGSKTGTVVVPTRAALESTLEAFKEIGLDEPHYNHRMPLIQEYVQGAVHDCPVLYNRGEMRASFTDRRLRGTSSHGGAAAVAISTNEPELQGHTKALMDALSWHGPAQVEWIREKSSGTYKLLEINPRFWGTLRLAVAAGMDFPAMTVQLVRDGDVEPRFGYRTGVTLRCAIPTELLSICAHDKNKVAALLRFLDPRDLIRRDVVFVWRWRDPLPHIFRLVSLALRLFKRCTGAGH